MKIKKIKVLDEFVNERLDKSIPYFFGISRNLGENKIKNGNILVNDKIEKCSYRLKENDVISLVEDEVPIDSSIQKEDIDLDIIYEDEDILVVNKPQGMVVHPSYGHNNNTLVNALLAHCPLSVIGGVYRPGIVHRIDKDTSGLLVVAKNDFSHAFLSSQLKDHSMFREYYALVKGTFNENDGKIDLPIGRSKVNRQKYTVDKAGKSSITYFHVEKRYKDHTLLSVRLLTGRTHQIRVHMSYISHPIEGDPLYGKKSKIYQSGQILHAYRLTLTHPRTKEVMTFSCPLPNWFLSVLSAIDK